MKKILILLFTSTLLFCDIYSQELKEYIERPQFISPQVAGVIRYDQMPVALNTGRLDMNIPAINFSDPDFDFSMILSYNSGGFKPSESDGIVGLNWSLDLGGVIHREVRGVPDDLDNTLSYVFPYDIYYQGFLHVKNLNLGENFKDEAYNNPNSKLPCFTIDAYRKIGNTTIEPSSDIYTFNFGGHIGKFIIDFDGTPKVVSYSGNGKVKIDISGYNIVPKSSQGGMNIKIITDDGYIYTFGGSFGAMEYTALSWDNLKSTAESPEYRTISAFHLSEIQAPNGRILKIYYSDFNYEYHQNPQKLIGGPVNANTKSLLQNYLLSGQHVFRGPLQTNNSNQSDSGCNFRSYTLNKVAKITSIVTDNQRVALEYSDRQQTMFSNDNVQYCSEFGRACGAQLNSISRYDTDNNLIEKTTFTYSFSSRLFLSKIQNTAFGTYNFSYNPSIAIDPFTKSIDHWGFWNGRNGNLIPRDANGRLTNEREAGEKADVALLNTVTFPTGGLLKIQYEPHILHGGGLGGGARVHSTYFYANSRDAEPSIAKHYVYAGGGHCKLSPTYVTGYYNGLSYDLANSNGFNLSTASAYHIQYSAVSEYVNPEKNTNNEFIGPYTKTTFVTRSDNSSFASAETKIIKTTMTIPWGNTSTDFPSIEWRHKALVESYSHMRGKIKEKSFYTKDNKLERKESYTYAESEKKEYVLEVHTPRTESWSRSFALPWGIYTQLKKVYLAPYNNDTKRIETYIYNDAGMLIDTISENEFCIYNSDGYYINTVYNTHSDGYKKITEFKYSYELEGELYDWMRHCNILSPVVEKKVISNDSEVLHIKNHYSFLEKDLTNGYLGPRNLILSSQDIIYNDNDINKHVKNVEHDIYGNVLYQVEDNTHTVYIWSYQGKYPIAKIANATYSQVKEKIGNRDFDSISELNDPEGIMGVINSLREELPAAHIFTYTYKPLVGMLSATDPTGISTYYKYDESSGRLIETYILEGGIKRLLQTNDYHYLNK